MGYQNVLGGFQSLKSIAQILLCIGFALKVRRIGGLSHVNDF